MYTTKASVNTAQNFAKKEGSEYSPYTTVNVGEFAAAFILSKKEIIQNELYRILEIASVQQKYPVDFHESLDNIERQYYRAISITNPEVQFKIFSSFRTAIEQEIKEVVKHQLNKNNDISNIEHQKCIDKIKAEIFTEIEKALSF